MQFSPTPQLDKKLKNNVETAVTRAILLAELTSTATQQDDIAYPTDPYISRKVEPTIQPESPIYNKKVATISTIL
jgi:hypothetical protein